MKAVNIHEAKTHFSRLIERVQNGEEIVIAKAGRPVAKLVAFARPERRRRLGQARGRIVVRADFDKPLPKDIREALGG